MKLHRPLALACLLPALLAACGGAPDPASAPVTLTTAHRSSHQASPYDDVVQRIYVAYFGRPADPAGLEYWAAQYAQNNMPLDISAINNAYAGSATVRLFIDAFGTSQESQDLYPGDNGAFITAIYRNLFNRDPDTPGKNYWVDVLDRGIMTRPTAALWIMSGAQGSDNAIISNKLAIAKTFTIQVDGAAGRAAYSGMTASALARTMLSHVTASTDPYNFPDLQDTVDRLLGNCGVAGCTPSVQLLAFAYGRVENGYADIGIMPATGGAAVASRPAGVSSLTNYYTGATVQNGVASNIYIDSFLAWRGERLYRQGLYVSSGIPNATLVSTLALSSVCDELSELENGYDLVNPQKSWEVYRNKGPDSLCSTDDDTFAAVRLDMNGSTAPLVVDQPVHTLHASTGALTGFLVRNGLTISRVDANFANPTVMFTLPGYLMEPLEQLDVVGNTMLFTADSKLYAFDGAGSPGAPTLVANLAEDESVDEVAFTDGQDAFIAINSGSNTVRIVRYGVASKSTTPVGTVTIDGFGSATLATTPTKVVVVNSANGAIWTLPRAGGAAQLIHAPQGGQFSFVLVNVVGERIWENFLTGGLFSIMSDGSGLLSKPNAQYAGCIVSASVVLAATDNGCASMIVVESDHIYGYDAHSAAQTLDYGSVPATPAGQRSTFGVSVYAFAGQGAVLTRYLSNLSTYEVSAVQNFHVRAGQAGISQVTLP